MAKPADTASDPRLLPLLSVNFIGMLGMSIVIPFMVFIVRDYGGNGLIYGIVGAAYPAFQVIGSPILGALSDAFGRRKILMVSQFGTLLSWLLFMSAFLLPELLLWEHQSVDNGFLITLPLVAVFVARALDGLTGGNISVAMAYLADISTTKNRQRNFGKMAQSSSLGFVLGPAIAGVMAAIIVGYWGPLVLAAVIALVGLLLIWKRLPESRPPEACTKFRFSFKRMCGVEDEGERNGFGAIFKLPKVGLYLAYFFLVFLAFNFFYAGFPNHAAENLKWGSLQLGVFLSVMSLMMILVQGPLLNYLSRFFTEKALIAVGAVLMIVSFSCFSSTALPLVYLAAVSFALGNGLMWPSYQSLLSTVGGQKYQGSVQGLANAGGSLGSIFGLLGGGAFFTQINTWVFFIPAGIFVVLFVLSFQLTSDSMSKNGGAKELNLSGEAA